MALACGSAAPPPDAEYPSLVLPVRLPAKPAAKATGQASPPPSTLARGSLPASTEPGNAVSVHSSHGDLPDPEPLIERAWWAYPVKYDRGTIVVGEPELMCLPRPQPTPRRIGRFAFELWLGRELIDRLRFDFPLLAAEDPPEGSRRPLHETPRFAPGARVSVTLRVPASDRPTSARVFDRATGEAVEVSWPPRGPDENPRSHACPGSSPSGKPARARTGSSDAGR